ncbi:Cul5 [Bugula neritina]|uniref:Cullin-5 n=1 Tax=Bugula neritina TaxID=10212 RepID=A0A7J7JP63_BUGNE|nr:Cul5 [Bugula neritina]
MLQSDASHIRFESWWPAFVKPILLKLLKQDDVSHAQWFELFTTVHKICSWDDESHHRYTRHCMTTSKVLWTKLNRKKVYLYSHTMSSALNAMLLRVSVHLDDSSLLRAYKNEWETFFAQCDYLPKPFYSLENVMKKSTNSAVKQPTSQENYVKSLMLTCWNESIFSKIKHRLQDSAMHLVELERCGEAFDSQLVIGVRESYVNLSSEQSQNILGIYEENFEKAYLEHTEQFYEVKAPEFLAEHGVKEYMLYAQSKLMEEEIRAKRYLETRAGCESVTKLIECCVKVLVVKFKDTILAECPDMIKTNSTQQLELMFKLLDRVQDGVVPMLHHLQHFIKEAGLSDMHACASTITVDSEQYVEKLLELFRRFTELVSKAFNMDARFLTARDMAYKSLVNDTSVFKLQFASKPKSAAKGQPESKCPELLANYCDMLLRKTPLSKKLTSVDIEKRLKDLLLILKYVQNKDVFMRFHKAHLTRRLILETSADNEIEENMVDWLREIGMPAEYVNKLARMFQDIQLSADLNSEFKELAKNNRENSADVNIKILNGGAWTRASERISVSLPAQLEDFIPTIEDFYKRKHNGRKLHWNNLMSNGSSL